MQINPVRRMSLLGRMFWFLVAFGVLIHVAAYFFYGHERMVDSARTYAISVAERAYALDDLLLEQPELLPLLQHEGFRLERRADPSVWDESDVPRARVWPHNAEVLQAVRTQLNPPGAPDVSSMELRYLIARDAAYLDLRLPSTQGDWLRVLAATTATTTGSRSMVGVFMSLILMAVLAVGFVFARRFTGQLSRFVIAAEALGAEQLDRNADPLPEEVGPKELRRASVAFNQMGERVKALLRERSDMIAGISHDLRTLSTRLGLRMEYIDDVEQRAHAREDIELMSGILDQAVRFAKDDQVAELVESLDIASLVESIISEHADQGEVATAEVHGRCVQPAQPLACRRLFENLIDNALKYGGAVNVLVSAEEVRVVDPGAGFSTQHTADALAPYVRLDRARSQNLPGTGLGLSIANNICRRHGWSLTFAQTSPGFVVTVRFDNPSN